MASHQSTIRQMGKAFQRHWDGLKLAIKRRLGAFEPLVLHAYRSHAGNGKIHLVGRLIEDKEVDPPEDGSASVVRNVANTVRRFESDEIPGARLIARFGDTDLAQGETDNEGFYQLTIQTEEELEPGWLEVEVEVLESMGDGAGVTGTAEVMVPPPDADFGVITDLDDTVLETRATDFTTQIRLVFSKSAMERSPMPGAAPLYTFLEAGPDGEGWNPFFYVSNSGWGLYDLIERFLDHNGLPKGPIYLQDIAIVEAKSTAVGSETHKLDTIRDLFDDYPDLDFVLIGDSGQSDPETYRELVREHSDRIRAVLIRAVTPPERDSEVRQIIQEIADQGVPAAAAESSVSLARAAADFGLIQEDAIARVREGMVEKRGQR